MDIIKDKTFPIKIHPFVLNKLKFLAAARNIPVHDFILEILEKVSLLSSDIHEDAVKVADRFTEIDSE